jgi:hypothetical protein
VNLHRDEILVDEVGDLLIGIDLGIQPSTSASSRRRAEIQQHRPMILARMRECSIYIFSPLNRHLVPLANFRVIR